MVQTVLSATAPALTPGMPAASFPTTVITNSRTLSDLRPGTFGESVISMTTIIDEPDDERALGHEADSHEDRAVKHGSERDPRRERLEERCQVGLRAECEPGEEDRDEHHREGRERRDDELREHQLPARERLHEEVDDRTVVDLSAKCGGTEDHCGEREEYEGDDPRVEFAQELYARRIGRVRGEQKEERDQQRCCGKER